MTKNKKNIIGIVISVLFFTGVLIIWQNYHKPIVKIKPFEKETSSEQTPLREDWQPMVEKIDFWQNGGEKIINPESSEYVELGRILLPTLHKLNLQAKCVFNKERLQKIKEKNRVVELVFKQGEDLPISQWVQKEERYHIPTDEKGYRILENSKIAIFVLGDNLGEGMEGNILIGSEAKDREEKMWGCWAIQKEKSKDLDKTWIEKINKILTLEKHLKVHLEKSKEFCGWSTYAKCKTDTDCDIGGCSGQVCEGKGKGTITNCRVRECYRSPGYKCKCFNNKCQWLKIK